MSSRNRRERQRIFEVDQPDSLSQDMSRTHCLCCGRRFSDDIVWTEAGWIEVEVSGVCESCFDLIEDIPAKPERDDIPLEEGNHHA